jgi:alkanesulfonate monooxygenase SsuD/methylene tetrahydromethanopterin reductase-like flavin-dependent oxidoreductase (luciferase family)
LWRFADEHDFDWFSVSDHFQETPHRDGTGDCFESVATLTAAAAETTRVRVGCLVFSIAFRNPGLLAKSLTTIDHISNGRADCGIGAGWNEPEYRAFGYPFPAIGTREDQLEEYAQALRLLFDEPFADLSGTHYTLRNAPNNPKPAQRRLPLWIGGAGEKRTLRTAALFADGWNAPYLAPAEWRRKNTVLDRWCDEVGRDRGAIARTINVGFYMGADARGAARAEDRHRDDWGADTRGFTGFLRGTPAEAAARVSEFRAAGVERLNLALRGGPYDWDALSAFAEEVIPTVR